MVHFLPLMCRICLRKHIYKIYYDIHVFMLSFLDTEMEYVVGVDLVLLE